MRWAVGLLAFAAFYWRNPNVRADEPAPESAPELTREPAPELTQAPRVAWDPRWRPVATWEYVATGAVLAGSFALLLVGPDPPDNWRGGTPVDDVFGDVTLDDPAQADKAATVSDVLYFGSMAYRLVDTLGVAGIGYGDWYLARQMAMIDLESFSVVAAVMFGSQVFVGRQRPEYNDRCADPADPCASTSSARFRSFIAGHPATVLTAAGLTCTHHARMPLYGGGWGDTLACGLMIGAAGFTGATRVLAGKHYPTDLMMGYGLGTFAGFILPRLLHYGFSDEGYYDRPKPRAANPNPNPNPAPMLVRLMPWSEDSSLGVSASGIW